MNGMAVTVGILGMVINAVLAPMLTLPLWRAFREVLYTGMATTDLAWIDRVAILAGDFGLLAALVLMPGFLVAPMIVARIRP